MKKWTVCVVAAILMGCVSLKVSRVNPDSPGSKNGFRYYMPAPYLLVREDPVIQNTKTPVMVDGKIVKGAYEETQVSLGRMEIIYLPDVQRELAVKAKSFLGGHRLALQLEEGWKLTSLAGEGEAVGALETAGSFLEQLVSSAGDVASEVWPSGVDAGDTTEPSKSLAPGLYRILVQEDGSVELRQAMFTFTEAPPSPNVRPLTPGGPAAPR